MSINAGTVSAYLSLDTSGFTRGVQQAMQRLSQFGNGANSASARIANLDSAQSRLTNSTRLTNNAILSQVEGLEANNRSIRLIQSEYRTATTLLGNTGNEFSRLRVQGEALTRAVDVQRNNLQQLERAHEESARATGANSAQTQELEIAMNEARTELIRMERELDQTNRQINMQSSAMYRMGQRLNETGERFKKVGQTLTTIGSGLTTFVTLPIIGIGAASTKAAADFEQALSNIKAVSGATGEEMKQLSDLALKAGKDTSFSAKEAANGIEELIKAGVSTKDIINGGLLGALNLAAAGELGLADAAEIASTVLNAFRKDSLSVADAADILAGAANASATSVSEMKFGLSMVSAVASSVGMTFKDTSTALAVFAQNGLKGSDAGTSLKTMLMNLQPSTKAQHMIFKQLGLVTADGASKFYDATGKLKSLNDISDILKESMKGLTDAQRQQAMRTMFGSDAIRASNILFNEGAEGCKKMADAMMKVKAADVAKEKLNNLKGATEAMKGSLETAGIVIGNALLPTIKSFTAVITNLTNKFLELSPETQNMIVKIGLLVAGIGPAILIAGKFASAIGSIMMLFGGMATASAGATAGVAGATAATGTFGTVLAAVTGPIGITIAAIAGLTVAGIALYKHLKKEVIPEVDLFGDTVSEATKKAVSGYMELDNKATQCLMNLKINGGKISNETSKDQIAIYDNMGKQIKEGIQKKFDESYQTMEAFFKKSNKLSTTEEQKILNNMISDNKKKQKEIDGYTKRVNQIHENAKKHHGIISKQEQAELAQINKKMSESAIKNLSKTKTESNTILEKMKQQAGNITARQAAEVVKNSATQRDKTINNAKKEYSGTVSAIEKMRDETKSISKNQADALIKDAERQKTQAISKAKQMHSQVVAEAKKQAASHVSQVDWETGRIITGWDRVVSKVISAMSWLSKLSLFGATGKVAAGIDQVKQQKAGQIGKNAQGTNYWRGGLTWVGEKGPELMNLPTGTQIYSNQKSKAMVGNLFANNLSDLRYLIRDELRSTATSSGITINMGSVVIREEADIKKVATELFRLSEKEKRARGIRG